MTGDRSGRPALTPDASRYTRPVRLLAPPRPAPVSASPTARSLVAASALIALALVVDAACRPSTTAAFTTIGGSLGTSQRGFRAMANFPGAAANDDTSSSSFFPGIVGSTRAIARAHAEWASLPWAGSGGGDPLQAVLGSGGANFDTQYLGETPFDGGINGNVHSYQTADEGFCGGGTLAVTLAPISDGWTIRYCPEFDWDDGPGSAGLGLIDLQGIACHEIGHALGLGHSTAAGATMRAAVSGSGNALRSIEGDDVAGLQSIYGALALGKPQVTGLVGSTSVGGVLVVEGTQFSSGGNEVWFTPAGGSSQPVKVKNLSSSNAGTRLAVVVPQGATSGQLIVKKNASGGASLSNAWPFEIGASGSGVGAVPKLKKQTTVRASLGFGQLEVDDDVTEVALSGSGRFVAYTTASAVPAPGDANALADVFLRDVKKGTTQRVSAAPGDVDANGASGSPAVSRSGRFVVFVSDATNLIDGATTPAGQVYRFDRVKDVVELVSRSVDGAPANGACAFPTVSDNGRFIAYQSVASNLTGAPDGNGVEDVFVTDVKTSVTTRVSRAATGGDANGSSIHPFLSGNGRVVVFSSDATDLVEGDVGPDAFSVFAHTLKTGVTELVSARLDGTRNALGAFAPSTSRNGRRVAFFSDDPQLVDGDTNGVHDVFVRDRKKGTTLRASIAPTPDPNLADLSALDAGRRALSASGRFVVYSSASPDVAPGDPNGGADVFVFDTKKGVSQVISVTPSGALGAQGGSVLGTPSSRGRTVAFLSSATELVGDDTNGVDDAFVRRW